MATLTAYKGLDVVEGATGDAGIALTDNFKELADRAPYETNANPTSGDDSADGFAAGDQWLNTSTQVMWACVSASPGAAVWKSLFYRSSTELDLIPQETSEKVVVKGNLQVDGSSTVAALTSSGQVSGSSIVASNNTTGGSQLQANNANTAGRAELLLAEASATKASIAWRCTANSSGANRMTITTNSGTNGDITFAPNGSTAFFLAGGQNGLTAGFVGLATTAPASPLDVNGDRVRIRTAKTPASASATGVQGEICWDSNYLYVCVATNTWKRIALSTW